MKRFGKAHIYQNTRCSMRLETKRMFVQCLRDYERHSYLPTRRTRPALLKRRYSVDVNTSGWDNLSCRDFGEHDDQQVRSFLQNYLGQRLPPGPCATCLIWRLTT